MEKSELTTKAERAIRICQDMMVKHWEKHGSEGMVDGGFNFLLIEGKKVKDGADAALIPIHEVPWGRWPAFAKLAADVLEAEVVIHCSEAWMRSHKEGEKYVRPRDAPDRLETIVCAAKSGGVLVVLTCEVLRGAGGRPEFDEICELGGPGGRSASRVLDGLDV